MDHIRSVCPKCGHTCPTEFKWCQMNMAIGRIANKLDHKGQQDLEIILSFMALLCGEDWEPIQHLV